MTGGKEPAWRRLGGVPQDTTSQQQAFLRRPKSTEGGEGFDNLNQKKARFSASEE